MIKRLLITAVIFMAVMSCHRPKPKSPVLVTQYLLRVALTDTFLVGNIPVELDPQLAKGDIVYVHTRKYNLMTTLNNDGTTKCFVVTPLQRISIDLSN